MKESFQAHPIIHAEKALPITDVLKLEPKLQDYLIQENPPKIDLGNSSALRLYNLAVLKAKYGLEIVLPDKTLIPTPGIRYSFLKHMLADLDPENTILEIGTGASAVLAMMAAKCFGYAITATEMGESLKWANKNIRLNELTNKINVLDSQGSILQDLSLDLSFSLIFSYPPLYSDTETVKITQKDRGFLGVKHELIGGGKEGEKFIIQLIKESKSSPILKKGGTLALLLIPSQQRDQIILKTLKEVGMEVRLTTLLAGTRKRIILEAIKQ
ncbi:MAG: RlmF-related methyltransferase [Candidatus Hermodarchaeota archaeon]